MTQMLKDKLVELGKMTERVIKVEKLLCETLENMDIQQKQYEAKIESLNSQLENKQIYLESFIKNVQMDKVVIKNREQRIAELTQKVIDLEENMSTQSSMNDGASIGQTPGGMTPGGPTPGGPDVIMNSTEIASLTGQLEAARAEIEEWRALNERNPEATKLEAEKKDL